MSDELLSNRLASRFAHELVASLGTALGASVAAEPAPGPAPGSGLLVSITATGAQTGGVVAWVDGSVADAAAQAATGSKGLAQDDLITFLREMATQVCTRLALAPEYADVRFAVSSITAGPAPASAALFQFPIAEGASGIVGVSASIATMSDTSAPHPNGNLDLVLDVELPLVVRFGRTVMSLKALSGLGPGSIVDMGRSPDDPVELLVSDKVIAYGEVVIVDGSYGLRVTDLVSRSDRLRALESR